MEFLQSYTFILKHHARTENKVTDALSRRALLLNLVSTEVVGLERLKEEYEICPDFSEVYRALHS